MAVIDPSSLTSFHRCFERYLTEKNFEVESNLATMLL